jgi:GDP-L-fucose synthase
VIPALIRRFHEAVESKADEIIIWGTGNAMREFLHVDDMASASIHVMDLDQDKYEAVTDPMLSHINVGTGEDCTIRELAELIAEVTEFKGTLIFDSAKPDGAPRKLLDTQKLSSLGWSPKEELKSGLTKTYHLFTKHLINPRSK